MQQHEWVHRGKTSEAQNFIREYVKEKRKYGDYTVIDIGGGLGNWAQDFSDLCLDMNPMNDDKAISGDVYDESTWNDLPLEKFDMAILSHILEDVRDPFFLIEKALKLADKIFVSVPSIQLEFSKIESSGFTGYHHHRWLFSANNRTLFIAPKTSISNLWINKVSKFNEIIEYFRYKLAFQSKYSFIDTKVGWRRLNNKKHKSIKVDKYSSLSLLISKQTEIISFDYIESGKWLFDKYNIMLEQENSQY